MNRYEISVSNFTGHASNYLGMYTVHASSPRVALQRVIQQRLDFPMKLLPSNASMISLKFDIVNRGKVMHIAEVRWEDCRGHAVTIDGITYSTSDDYGKCKIERKCYGYRTEYILANEPIPEGWEVQKRNEPYQYRFKPTARLAVLMDR